VRPTLLFACFGFLFALAGCAETPPLASYAYVRPPDGGSYVLRPNDQLRIRVYNETEVSGDYQIDGNGLLSVPLAGEIKAAGLTASKLEGVIKSRLAKGIIRDPRVAVQVTGYGPVYIQGEVKRGGEYPYRPGLTVMDAVASAGGFTYRADEKKVFVRRAGASGEEVYSSNAPVPLYPGDNIRIPERFF
jgi:polysaccharide biosynthesis/export protein